MACVMGNSLEIGNNGAATSSLGATHFIPPWRGQEYRPGEPSKASQISKTAPKTKKSPAAERPPGIFILNDLQRSVGRSQHLAEHAGFRQSGNPRLVIAERLA